MIILTILCCMMLFCVVLHYVVNLFILLNCIVLHCDLLDSLSLSVTHSLTLCLCRFSTPYEAGRAAAEPVTFLGSGLDSHVMLSCTQLSSALARSLNLHIDDAGALAQGSGLGLGKGVISSPFPSSRHNESQSRPERPTGAGLELR